MLNLQNALMLTDKGYSDLKKAIAACTLTNLALMLPFGVTVAVFGELLKPLMGQEISWPKMWVLLGCGLVAAGLVFGPAKTIITKPIPPPTWKPKPPGSA